MTRRLALRLKHEILGTPLEPAAIFMANRLLPLLRDGARATPSQLAFESLYVDRVIARILKPDTTCIDVGAHIGRFLSLCIRLAPKAAHVAVEPTPWKADWLKRKFRTAAIVNAALADAPGRLPFVEDLEAPAFSRLDLVANGKYSDNGSPALTRYDVAIETLDRIAAGAGKIGFIKIDVEGAEHLVIKGGEQTIARDRPAIVFEAGAVKSRHAKNGTAELAFSLLTEKLGYKVQTPLQFLLSKNALTMDHFVGARSYPFTALNFVATPAD
ncbi:MAG: FkbM family methyltransferase [Pseudomonadota bacterium]|nr:FkbM family methyltransferase [Pseudomonadota bacterium]